MKVRKYIALWLGFQWGKDTQVQANDKDFIQNVCFNLCVFPFHSPPGYVLCLFKDDVGSVRMCLLTKRECP